MSSASSAVFGSPSKDNLWKNTYAHPSSNVEVCEKLAKSALNKNIEDANPGFNTVKKSHKTETLHQLSTNALPPYHPGSGLDYFGANNSTELHGCSDCGDMFVCKSSLTDHLQRRSVLIRFNCDSCKNMQVFYNRCNLLSHIRAHADKNEPADISKVTLSPLPHILMDGVVKDIVKCLEEDDSLQTPLQDDDVMNPSKLLEVSITEGDENSSTVSDKKQVSQDPLNSETKSQNQQSVTPVKSSKKLRCSECDKEFDSAAERKDHFINGDKIPMLISVCPKCGILCPTECSSKAHKRLHLQVSPYVCPECGDNPDRYWETFQKHLKYQCFHYARSVGYKCIVCSKLLQTTDTLKKHFTTDHTQLLFKCYSCPMAFTSFASFHTHRKRNHVNSELSHIQLMKCAICDVVFRSKKDIDSHLLGHVKENTCQYTFSCMECGTAQESKLSLRKHLNNSHPKVYQQHVAFLNLPDEVVPVVENTQFSPLNSSRMECLLCHCSFLSRQSYTYHMGKSHSHHKYPCGVCLMPAVNRMEMVSHGKEHLRKNISICLLCHNKPIKPPEMLDVHLLYHVERVRFQTFCPICDGTLLSFEEALQHLRVEHLLQRHPSSVTKTQQEPTKTKYASTVVRETDVKPCTLDIEMKPEVSSVCLENSVKTKEAASGAKGKSSTYENRLRTGENVCKCSYKTANREEFKKHLLSHKESKSTFQCQECGCCFIVEPSLHRHLKAVHRVLDTDAYIAEEGANYTPESETTGSTETTASNALECNVCFEVFPSDAQLKTHMRSHGMAFIQARRASLL